MDFEMIINLVFVALIPALVSADKYLHQHC